MIYFVRKYNCYQLSDSCKNQISVKRFQTLSFSSSQAEIILGVVNVSFYDGSDFGGAIPFFCTSNSSGIGTKLLFWINTYHFATSRSCTWIITCVVTLVPASRFIFDPLDFRTGKLISDNTASEF